ncbi:MAG: hypothetical protein AB7O96_04175 [Pseudobdellovibrionaceae bacterium]
MKDTLHEIFLKYLHVTLIHEDETMDELVHHVVAEYMHVLMQSGNIPERWLDTLEEDLTEEVIDIYRKTTYGHPSLKSFREAVKNKKRVS